MRKSVLLPQRGQYFHPRFTPARAMRGQFDAQRPHEFRLPKHPLHRATILVAHPRVASEFGFESEFPGGPSFAQSHRSPQHPEDRRYKTSRHSERSEESHPVQRRANRKSERVFVASTPPLPSG
jgi:hypothetical protein